MPARQRQRIEPTDDWRPLERHPVERLFAHMRARLADRAFVALAAPALPRRLTGSPRWAEAGAAIEPAAP